MFEVATALGLVSFPMHTKEENIKAENRALKLLAEIIEKSDEWQVRLNEKEQVVLHTVDDNPRLMIDPCATIERFYKDGNEHIVTYMFIGPNTISACVVVDQDAPQCVITDTIISLVLLAEAGWPKEHTPLTLDLMRENLKDTIKNVPKRSMITEDDIERLEVIEDNILSEKWADALLNLGGHARFCYTCKGWTEQEVKTHINAFLDRIPMDQIIRYISAPFDASETIFITVPTLQ